MESLRHIKAALLFGIIALLLQFVPVSVVAIEELSNQQTTQLDLYLILLLIIIPIFTFTIFYIRTKYRSGFSLHLQKELHDLKRKYDLDIQDIKNSHQIELTSNKQECELTIKQKEVEFAQEIKDKIKEATKRSNDAQRVVIKGKDAEQMAPMLPEFCSKYTPADAWFFGSPFDYIIIDGMSEFNGGQKDIELKIIFLDTKTGNATLNKIQKAMKDAIEAGRVTWDTLKLKSLEKQNTNPITPLNTNLN